MMVSGDEGLLRMWVEVEGVGVKVEAVDVDAKGMSPEAMVLVLVFIFHGDIRTAFVGLGGKECRLLGVEVEVDVDAERNPLWNCSTVEVHMQHRSSAKLQHSWSTAPALLQLCCRTFKWRNTMKKHTCSVFQICKLGLQLYCKKRLQCSICCLAARFSNCSAVRVLGCSTR